MKKILLGLGTLATIVAPLTAIVACGSEDKANGSKNGASEPKTPKKINPSELTTSSKNLKNEYEGRFKTILGEEAFFKLTNVVADNQFEDNPNLESINLPAVEKIGAEAFKESLISEVNIPNVEQIWDSAFYNSKLTSLSVPKVKKIGNNAFHDSKLTSLSLPEVKSIGDGAFSSSELTSLSLPEVKSIGDGAFGSTKLTSIDLPKVESIGDYAFGGSKLTSLDLPNIKSIGEHAISLVNSPNTKVTLPIKFGSQEEKIFSGRVDKVDFTWINNDGRSLTDGRNILKAWPKNSNAYWGDISNAFDRYSASKFRAIDDEVNYNEFDDLAGLIGISLPRVKTIKDYGFTRSPLTFLSLPEVETIGEWAFSCAELTSLSLPKVREINKYAFEDAPLTSLSLPEAVEIGYKAFKSAKLASLSLPKVRALTTEDTILYHGGGVEHPKNTLFSLVNSPNTKVTLPSKFNTPEELKRIFDGPVDQVSFTWV